MRAVQGRADGGGAAARVHGGAPIDHSPWERRVRWKFQEVKHRRRDVIEPCGVSSAAPALDLLGPEVGHDQRDSDCGFAERPPVAPAPVLPEFFAVVRSEDDQGVLEEASGPQGRGKQTDRVDLDTYLHRAGRCARYTNKGAPPCRP